VSKSAKNDPFLAPESLDEAQRSVARAVALGAADEPLADLIAVAKRGTQRRARGARHAREVNDLDTDGGEIAVEPSSLIDALPVIALEENASNCNWRHMSIL